MGMGRAGKRRIILIIGGTVTGPYLSGKVLDIGADWQTIFDNGLAELDTRYAFQTDDGAVIEIINYGLRHGPAGVMAKLAAGEELLHQIATTCAPMHSRDRACKLSMGEPAIICGYRHPSGRGSEDESLLSSGNGF